MRMKAALTIAATSITLLAGCVSPTPQAEHAAMHDADHMETLPIEYRVAFMSGHVEAGLALYRAGAPDQAAKHLLHPVSETHASERAGIDALGFKPDVFETVSAKLDQGAPAKDIEPLLQDAEANMSLMQTEAGGNPHDIILFLMDTAEEEYGIGVTNGVITDPGEYQDAYGFSVVALNIAKRLDRPAHADLVTQLEILVDFWPASGPLAASTPAPEPTIFLQIANVRSALLAF